MVALSVVIPVYNEICTIGRVLLEVTNALPEVSKEIIIVDDCSKDGTSEWLTRNLKHAKGVWRCMVLNDRGDLQLCEHGAQDAGEFSFLVLFHEMNRGK